VESEGHVLGKKNGWNRADMVPRSRERDHQRKGRTRQREQQNRQKKWVPGRVRVRLRRKGNWSCGNGQSLEPRPSFNHKRPEDLEKKVKKFGGGPRVSEAK